MSDAESNDLAANAELRRLVAQRTAELEEANLRLQAELAHRRMAEEALRQQSAEWQSIIETLPDLHFRLSADGTILSWRGGKSAALYRPPEQFLGRRMTDVIPPDASALFADGMRRLLKSGDPVDFQYSLPMPAGERWYEARLLPLPNNQVLAIVREVTQLKKDEQTLRENEQDARKAAEFNRRLLLEVDHRVKNNLAGLLGLVSLARQRSTDVDSFARDIEGRLMGMAHVHRLLADRAWQQMGLGTLVRSTVDALNSLWQHHTKMVIEGPDLLLSPQQAIGLTMILVEWFTNSCKHGAHSVPGGKVSLHWRRDPAADRPTVLLTWHEQSGPPVLQPVVPSLGTELIHGFASREMHGHCTMEFPPTGAIHRLRFPIAGESTDHH